MTKFCSSFREHCRLTSFYGDGVNYRAPREDARMPWKNRDSREKMRRGICVYIGLRSGIVRGSSQTAR